MPIVTPILLIHICCAMIGVISGFAAMFFRKGSGLHGAAGTVFFVSMLLMSSSGAIIAGFLRPNAVNVVASTLTFYLVSTAWMAAKRRDGKAGAFDVGALVWILAVTTTAMTFGIQAANSPLGKKDGFPPAGYFVFGTVALLHAVGDIRMLRRGGAFGAKRIARHLWRMCLALLIATASLYPGQARLFPKVWRDTNLLSLPVWILLAATIFWVVRVSRFRRVPAEARM